MIDHSGRVGSKKAKVRNGDQKVEAVAKAKGLCHTVEKELKRWAFVKG